MEIVTCVKGHFYDKSKGECPQCAAERAAAGRSAAVMDYGKTVPSSNSDSAPAASPAAPFSPAAQVSPAAVNAAEIGATIPVPDNDFRNNDFNASVRGTSSGNQVEDYSETRPVGFNQMSDFDPTVGWVICIDGPSKGQDYRLRAGNNRVGRSPKNAVCLQGDITVSAEDNCTIGYDNRSGRFLFAAGNGKNMVYVNNEVVFNYVELHAYDIITVGNTNLMFVPLCGEHFSW